MADESKQKPRGAVNKSLAEKMTGRAAPKKFMTIDAQALDYEETHKIVREDVKLNRIVFEFPSGLNKLSLLEECRALTLLEDFDAMYDITMQLLDNKDLRILMRNNQGALEVKCEIHVTNRFQDLNGDNFISQYPVVITWLTEFMAAELLKKYPLPGSDQPQSTAAAKKAGKEKKPQA